MKRFLIMAVVCLLTTVLIAQTQYNTIKPAELVQNARENGESFTPTQLFTRLEGRNLTQLEVTNYTILQTDEETQESIRGLAPESIQLNLPAPGRSDIQLDLVKIENLYQGVNVIEASTGLPADVDMGVHYRGTVANDPSALVAISFNDGEMSGLITSPSLGNLVLGKLPASGRGNLGSDTYIVYEDDDIWARESFECGTPDTGAGYTREQLTEPVEGRSADDCVRIYFEVDHDIYLNKGNTTATVNYVTALFNQVALLYANENVNLTISEIFVWDTSSPYVGSSSGTLLSQFQNTRTSFNGDLAQLLSFQASGGIAVLNGLCHNYTPARFSFSSIGSSFNNVPTYSFSVLVVAHELGHLLGSHHTHACVWNGNNTAIDGCAGFVEGGCGNPGVPSGGGTIMSYCHITSTGIDLSQGFGPQPGTVIRNKVASATCTQACPAGGGGGGGGGGGNDNGGGNPITCDDNTVFLVLKLDDFSPETSWKLLDANNAVVEEGGPYPKTDRGQTMRDTFCLPDQCYSFIIEDEYEDGICCDYGQGAFQLKDEEGNIIADGGTFEDEEIADFCLPFTPNSDGDCLSINFNNFPVVSYGSNQDAGQSTIEDDGNTLYIRNNAWKAIMLDYNLTSQTYISFDFRSTKEGEIHGIGFDDNNNISYSYTFKLHGTQSWGQAAYDNYPGNGAWKSYVIPVGQYYTGQADRLFFNADHDGGTRDGNAWFRNVRIYEGNGCDDLHGETTPESELIPVTESLALYPNPVDAQVHVNVLSEAPGQGSWSITDAHGRNLRSQNVVVTTGENQLSISTDQLPPGAYLLRWHGTDGYEQSKRFVVSRS